MNVGIGALLMSSESSFKNAGISKYIASIVNDFVENAPGDTFHVFVDEAFVVPPRWNEAKHCHFHPVASKNRFHRIYWEHFGVGQQAKKHDLDVWFATAHARPVGAGIPSVVMIHDLFPILFPELFTREKVLYQGGALRDACRRAEALLMPSTATRDGIVKNFGTPAEKLHVVPHGPGNIAPLARREDVTTEELRRIGVPFDRYLFTLCTLEPRKNLVSLVEAFAQVVKEPDLTDVGLAVAGAKGWKESAIFEKVRELGLEEKIAFLGYVETEDLPKLFARAEAFVYPSLYEGFGIPVLEAMTYGAPVLSSRDAALSEIAGDTARYFEATDLAGMAATIVDYLRNGDRDSMVARGSARAKEFTWRRSGQQTLEVLRSTAKR